MPRLLPRVMALVVIGFVVLGALLPARGLTVVLRDPGGMTPAVTVTIDDQAGLVTGVAEATVEDVAAMSARDSFAAVPGRRDAIVYQWVGGACDRAATIHVSLSGSQVELRREDMVTGNACLMIGITRAVVIEFREPLDPASIVDLTNLLF